MKKDLSSIFGKFVGREIPVREVFDGPSGKTLYAEPLNSPEPVFEEMKKAAKSNGLTLRVIFPGARITKDRKPNRVNIPVEKAGKGKWRVGEGIYKG